ncbi:MAG: CapA family protein [Bacteroidota bacterium]
MKNTVFGLICLALSSISYSQGSSDDNSVSLVFIGDIMGHDSQIASALNESTGTYSYKGVFDQVGGIISKADFAIANLEVTLAGPPFKGYPQFSSPDELAVACQENGIDVFVTANNHSCDRGKSGVIRTIDVLDSLGIDHTGTYRDAGDRESSNLLTLEKNGIKLGILNYTYGTNGLPAPAPTIVNLIDKKQMAKDIEQSKKEQIDKLIVVLHWGLEYKSLPNDKQKDIADFLFNSGVDVIIGSHPHVLQPMHYFPKDESHKERFIAYSLGNFVSNQRTRQRDGGAIVELTFSKVDNTVSLSDHGYYLTWVNKPKTGSNKFEIVPCAEYEKTQYQGLNEEAVNKMKVFIEDSRTLLNKENTNVQEIKE